MRRPIRSIVPALTALQLGTLGLGATTHVLGQWTVSMRALSNPLPLGQCTAIEVVATDNATRAAPLRPNGRQVDWQDFELSFTATAPDAFAWSNETHRFLCARAPSASSAIVVAHYPGNHLQPNERLAGVDVRQQIEVVMQSTGVAVASAGASYQPTTPAPQAYNAGPAGGQPPPAQSPANGQPSQVGSAAGQPDVLPSAVPPSSAQGEYSQPAPAPAQHPTPPSQSQPSAATAGQQPPPPSSAYPPGSPAQSYPQTGSAPPSATESPGQPSAAPGYTAPPVAGAPPTSGYPQGTPTGSNGVQPNPAPGYPATPQPTPASSTPAAQSSAPDVGKPAKGIGGLFKKIGNHAKKTAKEVTSQTAENLASGVNQVVDVTAQTGSGLVSGATAQASSAVRTTLGGVGTSILSPKGKSDNLSVALNDGLAEFRNKLFSGTTDVLEPAGRELVDRLAAEFKARPGKFEIQVHTDPIANALQVSERRAAVLKDALLRQGVERSRFEALGYGVSAYQPQVPPDGGAPSSERVVISRVAAQ
jgi:outer membrane protein OmpA-like peptidoglycan-associated protein